MSRFCALVSVGVLFASLAALATGCQDLQVLGGPVHARHVLFSRADSGSLTRTELFGTGAPLGTIGPTSGYTSTNADLRGLADTLNYVLALDVDFLNLLLTVRPTGDVTTMDFSLLTPSPTIRFGTSSTDPNNPLGLEPLSVQLLIEAYNRELHRRTETIAALAPASRVTVLPEVTAPEASVEIEIFPGPVHLTLPHSFLNRFQVRLSGGRPGISTSIEARWERPMEVDRDDATGVLSPEPVLVFAVHPNSDDDVREIFRPYFVFDIFDINFEVRVQPVVCNLPDHPPIAGAPECSFDRARSGMFLGYTTTLGDNASLPDINLDVRIHGNTVGISRVMTVLPTCFLFELPGMCAAIADAVNRQEGTIVEGIAAGIESVANTAGSLAGGLPLLGGGPGDCFDIGLDMVAISPRGTIPAIPTATFGAAGGRWTATSLAAFDRGGTLALNLAGCGVTAPPEPIGGSRDLARLLSGVPYVAIEARRIFVEPILAAIRPPPPRPWVSIPDSRSTIARLASITPTTVDGATAAHFSFMLDRDLDGVEDRADTCFDVTDVPDSSRHLPDVDGDGLPDACDTCAGVHSRVRTDTDLDGFADPCDCNVDGDACTDRPAGAGAFGTDCTALVPVPDRAPGILSTADLDGDRIPDDCDPDTDGDGVVDGLDNCPRDVNPDQRDSGGTGEGDACDASCRFPGAPGCMGDLVEGGLPPDFEFDGAHLVPSAGEMLCLDRWDGCAILAGIDTCAGLGDDCGAIGAFGAISNTLAPLANYSKGIDPAVLALGVSSIPDQDGDGVSELVIGAPDIEVCDGATCRRRAGSVRAISARGAELFRIDGDAVGARLGMSFAVAWPFLAVGVPGARNEQGIRTGAVRIYYVETRKPRLVATLYGEGRGDKLGRSVVLAGDLDEDDIPEVLASAPGASTAAGAEAGRVYLLAMSGEVRARFDGTIRGGRLGDDASVILPRKIDPGGVFVGSSRARPGGAVTFFAWDGTVQWVLRGRGGDRLGASLAPAVDFDRDGIVEVGVGAPGARGGRGALRMVSPFGTVASEVRLRIGRGFGSVVSVPGDLNHDGLPELVATVMHEDHWWGVILPGLGTKLDFPIPPPGAP